ncbi:retrovirus-related Pol polyprotein from transposon 412 [Trichonephila clavipes]|nr:retrovirus-related Pol polyprotein from transposon 412 [Trichonephila clavipes]
MKTLQKVCEHFYWNNVRCNVEKCCRICDPCAARKGPRKHTRGRPLLYNMVAPFKRIAFDILGLLPGSPDGNNKIRVVMDYFTKWPEAYSITDQPRGFDCCRGFSSTLDLTIRGLSTTALRSREKPIQQFERDCVKYSPSTKPGQQLCILSLTACNQQDWDKKLPLTLLAYKSAVHETTGYSPSQMLFGRDIRLPADLLFGQPPDAPLAPDEYIEKLQRQRWRKCIIWVGKESAWLPRR